jgi:hypothetical protein
LSQIWGAVRWVAMIEWGPASMKKYFGHSAVCSSVLIGTL